MVDGRPMTVSDGLWNVSGEVLVVREISEPVLNRFVVLVMKEMLEVGTGEETEADEMMEDFELFGGEGSGERGGVGILGAMPDLTPPLDRVRGKRIRWCRT